MTKEKPIIEKTSTRLKKALDDLNWKQKDLLDATQDLQEKLDIKLSRQLLSHYFTGYSEPSAKTIFLLSETLGINPGWLLGYDVPKKVSSTRANPPSNTQNKFSNEGEISGDINITNNVNQHSNHDMTEYQKTNDENLDLQYELLKEAKRQTKLLEEIRYELLKENKK